MEMAVLVGAVDATEMMTEDTAPVEVADTEVVVAEGTAGTIGDAGIMTVDPRLLTEAVQEGITAHVPGLTLQDVINDFPKDSLH